MANEDLRNYAKSRGVFLWEIAREMKISETTVTRWLRTELVANDKRHFKEAVDRIQKKKMEEDIA